jgi:hypothetical protein
MFWKMRNLVPSLSEITDLMMKEDPSSSSVSPLIVSWPSVESVKVEGCEVSLI